MAGIRPGRVWNPIWESGVWTDGVWTPAPFIQGVSPGRVWGTIWTEGVWVNGVWATDDIVADNILVPISIVGSYEWTPIGGTSVNVLKDGSDLTYIESENLGSAIQMSMENGPVYSNITGATIRLRLKTGG